MIDILMAAYNGGRYITAQLDSLVAQTSQDWRLLIRDDGSKDDTVAICRRYVTQHPERIQLITDSLGRLGPRESFSRLQDCSHADYLMFCDQDDFWLPDKVATTLAAMRRLEARYDSTLPALVYTDARVANENLDVIAPSLLRYLGRAPNVAVGHLFVESPVYGNTTMINRALKQRIGRVPEGAVQHDWWFALGASVFGRIDYVDKPTILYRRHSHSVSGARKHGLSNYLSKSLEQHREFLHRALRQCEIFQQIFGAQLGARHKLLFAAAARVRTSNWFLRRYLIIRHGLWKTGFLKNIGLLAAI